METEPCVEARPPALIESAVGLIVPPAAREHVLGDLAERYASPGLYVLEAARYLPFVFASQIRRTSHFVAWPMIALMLATWGRRAEPARGAAADARHCASRGATRGTAMNVMRQLVASLVLAIAVAAPMAQTSPTPPTASDADIRKILADRIDVNRQAVGIVVGVVDANGRRIVAYGKRAANDPRLPDGDTVFEIGSITKVFTSLLLADAVERKEVALTDPVGEVLRQP